MTEVVELCEQIKSTPQIIADIDWVDETDAFDIQRMRIIVLVLDDIDLIDSVIRMIVACWDILESQDDPRCYKESEKGKLEIKFPDRDRSCDVIITNNNIIYPSKYSISGVLYYIKEEAMRTIRPRLELENTKSEILEKYSKPSEKEQIITPQRVLPEPAELIFFDPMIYSAAEKQQALKEAIGSQLCNIDITNGREWFAVYAAYRYAKGMNSSKKKYVDFFSDIENLFPGKLSELNQNEQGDKRYKHYTAQLSKEVDNWYVDKGQLPPINNLVFRSFTFHCSREMFNKLSVIIKGLYESFLSLERNNEGHQ